MFILAALGVAGVQALSILLLIAAVHTGRNAKPMQRKSIDRAAYNRILSKLEIERIYFGAMSIISGKHNTHGRVVLIRSESGFAVIADNVSTSLESQLRHALPVRQTINQHGQRGRKLVYDFMTISASEAIVRHLQRGRGVRYGRIQGEGQ